MPISNTGGLMIEAPQPLYAGFPARAAAMLIDLLLAKILYFSCFCAVLAGQLAAYHGQILTLFYASFLSFFFFLLSFPLFLLAYFLILPAWRGQTPGKMFMGIKIVRDDGGELSPAIAFLRLAGYGLSLLPLGLGFIQAGFHREARAWHDQLSGTRVIKNAPWSP